MVPETITHSDNPTFLFPQNTKISIDEIFINFSYYLSDNYSFLFYVYVLSRPQARKSSLTHWGRVMHICVGKLTILASDNGLSPGRHQAIIWTNAGILFIRPLETNFSEILT